MLRRTSLHHPRLSADGGRRDAGSLGGHEGTVIVDALTVALEVVQAGEAALAGRVGALVGFGPNGIVGLGVGLYCQLCSYIKWRRSSP